MSERHVRRYDPKTMAHDAYLGDPDTEGYDQRVVTLLSEIFTPLITEYTQKAKTYLDKNPLETLPLSGKEPSYNESLHDVTWATSLYPDVTLKPFPHQLQSSQVGGRAITAIYVPVGEYGEAFAAANLNTARAMYTILGETMIVSTEAKHKRYRSLLHQETFQQHPYYTLRESIQTTAGMFAVFTAQRVSGYEADPLRLCRDIVNEDILNYFAATAKNGEAFPLASRGFHFDHPLTVQDGRLQFTDEMRSILKAAHTRALSDAKPNARGRGCPVAHKTIPIERPDGTKQKQSGVNVLAEFYLDILSYYLQQENPIVGEKPEYDPDAARTYGITIYEDFDPDMDEIHKTPTLPEVNESTIG